MQEYFTTIAEAVRPIIQQELSKAIQALNPPQPPQQKALTRKELCELWHISLPTLNKLTKDGKVTKSKIGTRVLYTPEAINEALKSIRVK